MTLKIAITGGGIAGLTAALAFSNNGHSVRVFERAKAFEDVGAGIQLSPNANRVLSRLGLADAVRAISFEPENLQLVSGKTGRALSTLPFKNLMQRRYGSPYLVAHRGDLQVVLLEAIKANPLIKTQTSRLINRFNPVTDGIEIAGEKFDFLIVADGINSTLRNQIDPSVKVVADGQTAWRATLPIDDFAKGTVSVFMNSGVHLVAYQMGAKPMLNLVFVSSSDQPPSDNGFGGAAKQLINAAKDWKPWPLASVTSHTWHNGRAVMIGDAAHAMTPHAAQGGAMAIEDAMVLAHCVDRHAGIETAFQAFQVQRQPRLSQVTALSKQNRAIYQMGGVMALGRNAALPMLPPTVLLRRLDWLYGWLP